MLKVFFSNISLPYKVLPYQWGLLRAYAERNPVIVENYRFEPPFYHLTNAREVFEQIADPDVFAMSCYVWNFQINMKICKEIKTRYPKCFTIAGGPHIPDVPGDFFEKHPYVDVLVHGEGEMAFHDLLIQKLKRDPDFSSIAGISFKESSKTITNQRNPKASFSKYISDEELPSPYLSGYFDDLVQQLSDNDEVIWALLETNRGCPYDCTFCEWGVAALAKIKQFSIERIFQEIDFFSKSKIPAVYITDANFGILQRDMEIANKIISNKKTAGFPRSFSTNFAKNSNERIFNISKALANAEMIQRTTLAIQSPNENVLKAIKRTNIGTKNYEILGRKYAKENIPSSTDVIVGLPEETKASWFEGLTSLLEAGHHNDINNFELLLLPNTPMNTNHDREKYGLKSVEKRLYASKYPDESGRGEVVYETNTMSFEDWIDCSTFTDLIIIAMHNGGYCRFVSQYLVREKYSTYQKFYCELFEYFKKLPDTGIGGILNRVLTLQYDYINEDYITSYGKVMTQRDMKLAITDYLSPEKFWWIYDWAWIQFNEKLDGFYKEIKEYIVNKKFGIDEEVFKDLFVFQRDVMLTPDFDPKKGKTRDYKFSWFDYFLNESELRKESNQIHFADEAMGVRFQHPLKVADKPAFALASCGNYFPDGRSRRYIHQFDKMKVSIA